MTDVTPAGSNLPAIQNPLARPEGLEDFDTRDQVMPVLKINHKDAVFEDGLSGQEFKELNVVIAGLVKQRVLWPAQMKESEGGQADPPLCRSYDFHEGHPSMPKVLENGQEWERFPWDAVQSVFVQGQRPLPCAECPLKEWNTHPTREAPWCSEQHTFALLFENEEGGFVPSLLSVQRSGLKSSRQYLSSFANAGTPLFTVRTKLTLEERKMGANPFAVPKFSRQGETDPDDHPIFSSMYRSMRDFLQTPRVQEEDTEGGEMAATTTQAAPATTPDATQTGPQAAPVTTQPVQAEPVRQPAPVQQAAPQAPVQEAPAQPTPAPAPAAEPAAVPQTPQPAPMSAPGIAGIAPQQPAPAPTASEDDEIPF